MTKKNDFLMQVINKVFKLFSSTLKYIILGVNILVLVLLLSSYSTWNTSPIKSVYLAYLGLGFIFILLGVVFFTIMWFCVKKWTFGFLNLIVLIICYAPIKDYVPLNYPNTTIPDNSVKILSYNVRGFNWDLKKGWGNNSIYKYIKESNADIVCIQEYLASVSQLEATSEKLRVTLGYPYAAITPLRGIGNHIYGLACFSKYPIKSVEKLPLVTSDNGSVLYTIDINGKTVSLINNHLESNRLTDKDKEIYASFFKDPKKEDIGKVKNNLNERLGKAFKKRAPQAEMIAKYIDEQNTDAVIVCGDFNDTPMSYTYNQISKNLVDSYVENGFGPGITYHENHFLFRIDFILHSKNMKSSNFVVDKVTYSDHYPISTYLSFKD